MNPIFLSSHFLMLYIHIPFCHSKCAYCDFYSVPRRDSADALVDALVKEFELRRHEVRDEIDTIYLGGGTPSSLSDAQLERLIGSLPRPNGEFTIEVNPEDVSVERVARWHSWGVNRVSMGVQSFSDSELKAIGRRHTAEQAYKAACLIRRGGIDNISLDLIYGLPRQTLQTWQSSLSRLLEFRPTHLSAYILSYEPGTRLTALLHAGKIEQAHDSLIEEMYSMLCELSSAAGYEHYEISNFALPGYRAQHNSGYWHGVPYLGLGPSAHSFDGHTRRINPASVKEYLGTISRGFPACVIDPENDDNRFNDLLVTRLRTSEGLPFSEVPTARMARLLLDAEPMAERGEVILTPTHICIPESHWLTSDAIITNLMQI